MGHRREGWIVILAAITASCGGDQPQMANNSAEAADVDVLPPDESVDTASEDLANGAVDEPADANAGEVASPDANQTP